MGALQEKRLCSMLALRLTSQVNCLIDAARCMGLRRLRVVLLGCCAGRKAGNGGTGRDCYLAMACSLPLSFALALFLRLPQQRRGVR
jgi:hypothetical protein